MDSITDYEVRRVENVANLLRQEVIHMLVEAGSGHVAGPLGMADILATLYFHTLRHDPKKPEWKDRDRFVLSNGHTCPILYAALAHAGYFPPKELKTLRKLGTRLQGHPHRTALPGIETTSGPLGSGLAQAVGMALAAKIDKAKWRTYVVTSDGEHQEGNHWEAVMTAGKYRLSNLVQVIDRNVIQIDGFTEDVMPLEPLADKYKAFNWNVLEVNGHDVRALVAAFTEAKATWEQPTVIIAHTTPGKGVDFMENRYEWHSKVMKPAEIKTALDELRTLQKTIKSEHQ
jgi:transketolase